MYLDREKEEYEKSDIILVPSNFVKGTFEKKHLSKIRVLEFGVNTENFFRDDKIKKSVKYFDILYLANKSVRKGFHYVLESFKKFQHPNKRLHIVGSHTSDKNYFDHKISEDNMIVYGHVDHLKLNKIINQCHVYLLPISKMVLHNNFTSGIWVVLSSYRKYCSSDFVKKSNCGFVIPIRSVDEILKKLIFTE